MTDVEDLITDNIDIWTSAIKRKSSSGRGSGKKVVIYGVKKLRELILDLAVRGLLVPQDPSDEPASVLLERVAAEKAGLVKTKTIKKQKAMPQIADDEKPFELPVGWDWCFFGELATLINGDRGKNYPNKDEYTDEGVPWINTGHIEPQGTLSKERMNFISETKFASLKGGKIETGDLVYCLRGATFGKTAFVVPFNNGAIASSLMIIRPVIRDTAEYIFKYLTSPLGRSQIYRFDNGSAQPNLSANSVTKYFYPCPPLKEQHRIVAKVDELMALCDQLEQQTEASLTAHQTLVKTLLDALTQAATQQAENENSTPSTSTPFEKAWQRLAEHFDTVFTTEDSIDQLKQTILQLAVIGKLVPQDPNDEPASELLKRIAVEKAELVKAKKIKKQKALPDITDDEKPFELPAGWEFCRLIESGYDIGGGTPSKSTAAYWNGDIPWVCPKDMKVDYLTITHDLITQKAIEETTVKRIPAGSLLIVVRGMILAHSFPVAISSTCVAINQDMKALVFTQLDPGFMLIQMKSVRSKVVGTVDRSSHGTCKLTSEKLWNLIIPIPPLLEQQRILAKVNELTTICDQLKARLTQAQANEVQLADTITKQAIHQ